jgi:class 3 adenylate cyclase
MIFKEMLDQALAMQAALRRYSDEVWRTHRLSVHVRVGLSSGEVVVRRTNCICLVHCLCTQVP